MDMLYDIKKYLPGVLKEKLRILPLRKTALLTKICLISDNIILTQLR